MLAPIAEQCLMQSVWLCFETFTFPTWQNLPSQPISAPFAEAADCACQTVHVCPISTSAVAKRLLHGDSFDQHTASQSDRCRCS